MSDFNPENIFKSIDHIILSVESSNNSIFINKLKVFIQLNLFNNYLRQSLSSRKYKIGNRLFVSSLCHLNKMILALLRLSLEVN